MVYQPVVVAQEALGVRMRVRMKETAMQPVVAMQAAMLTKIAADALRSIDWLRYR